MLYLDRQWYNVRPCDIVVVIYQIAFTCNTPTMQLSRHVTAAIVIAVAEGTSQGVAGSPCQDAPLWVWTGYAARHLTTLSWLEADQLNRRCEGLRQPATGRHVQDLTEGNTLLLRPCQCATGQHAQDLRDGNTSLLRPCRWQHDSMSRT